MRPLNQQTILITGSTDGLGKLVAKHLAGKGATVLLHGRIPQKGQKTLDEIKAATSQAHIYYYNADFASLQEVARLADKLLAEHKKLDVLINNAGIGAGPKNDRQRYLSSNGLELRFAVNYLAPFLLTHKLLPLLKNTGSRIINVSSAGQEAINFDDVMLEKMYDGFLAYRKSKLAQIMFTFDLAEELAGNGVTVNALHPASLMNTKMVFEYFDQTMSTVEDGAEAVEYLGTSQELDGVTGTYYNQKQPSRAIDQAYDKQARQMLKKLSENLVADFL